MKIAFMFFVSMSILTCSLALAENFDKLITSPIWQVRYGVLGKFNEATPDARKALEKLSNDSNQRVASQAFACYSSLFVELDKKLSMVAFHRGDFGENRTRLGNRTLLEAVDDWTKDLGSIEPTFQARAARAIGICGSKKSNEELAKYVDSENAYLLMQLALAFHRLGDTESYLARINAIMDLPIGDAFYYKTLAINYLIQTHPERSRAEWNRVHKEFKESPDFQSNWVYAHITQEARLPVSKGEQDTASNPLPAE